MTRCLLVAGLLVALARPTHAEETRRTNATTATPTTATPTTATPTTVTTATTTATTTTTNASDSATSTSPWIDAGPLELPEKPDDPASGGPMSSGRRALAVGASIFPGVIVHGSGAWVAGDKGAAKKLLAAQLIGGALMGISGAFVGGSHGNEYTIWPGVPVLIAGGGLVMQSWFTDIYVAAAGRDYDAGPLALPPWSVEAGTTWLHDAYRERALMRAAGTFTLGRVELGAGGLFDAGGDEKIGDASVDVRLYGAPSSGERIADATRIDARVGTRFMRDDADEVTQWIGEVWLAGRLDLSRIDRVFGASFATLSTGLGRARITYAQMASEWDTILLGRFGWGVYLGHRGEAQVFYDHRRDGLAGGIAAYRAAGFVGSVGASTNLRVVGPWTVRGELQIGNAWVTTLAVGYRGGGAR